MSHAELAAILSACFCALMSVSTIVLMFHSLRKARKARDGAPIDDPDLDATDAAHPAWWRGTDHAAARWHIRTQEAELERDKLRAELSELKRVALKQRANNSRWRLLEIAHREVRAERDAAREELREFKARLWRRTQRPAIFKQDFERRAWSWIVNNWHSLEPDQRAYQRDNAMKALKHDHEQVMHRLRERARLP